MSYTAEISRNQPTCIVILVDQSGSMAQGMPGTNKSKSEGVADAVNMLLNELVDKCTKDEDTPRDYFDIAVVGYGHGSSPASILGGNLAGKALVKVSEVNDNPLRVEKRQNANFAVWVDPIADGGTPMCEALKLVRQLLESWIPSHLSSYPPIVINITDGKSTDGEPVADADAVKALSTNDGNVLLFNCDISENTGSKVLFPSSEAGLPDVEHERNLYAMSSELPQAMLNTAQKEIKGVEAGARGFAFQANFQELIKFLDIGTKVVTSNLH